MIDLTELKVVGYEGDTKAKVEIQTLDDVGGTEASYFWYDYTNSKGKHIVGWLNEDDDPIEEGDVTFQPGEGLWTFCATAGFNLQSSGQVATSTVVVELQKNGLSVANPTPVVVDLTNCIVTGYEGDTKAKVEIQTLDDVGGTEASYFWYDYTNSKGKHIVGWLNEDDDPIEEGDVTVEPGAGLWSFCAADGFNFVWPGVDIK